MSLLLQNSTMEFPTGPTCFSLTSSPRLTTSVESDTPTAEASASARDAYARFSASPPTSSTSRFSAPASEATSRFSLSPPTSSTSRFGSAPPDAYARNRPRNSSPTPTPTANSRFRRMSPRRTRVFNPPKTSKAKRREPISLSRKQPSAPTSKFVRDTHTIHNRCRVTRKSFEETPVPSGKLIGEICPECLPASATLPSRGQSPCPPLQPQGALQRLLSGTGGFAQGYGIQRGRQKVWTAQALADSFNQGSLHNDL